VPAALITATAALTSLVRGIGLASPPLTADKAREILARHWTARSADSLVALGVGEGIGFATGARDTWAWYRANEWLR